MDKNLKVLVTLTSILVLCLIVDQIIIWYFGVNIFNYFYNLSENARNSLPLH